MPTTRNMQDTLARSFKDQPTGWVEITHASNAGRVSATTTYEKTVKTRFGTLAIGSNNVSLQFNGKPVLPDVEDNNSLTIVAHYEVNTSDVVLVQNTGGTGYPATYTFNTLTKTSMRATPEFETCSDIIRVKSTLKDSVTVVMNGPTRPFEPSDVRRKPEMTKL